MDAARYSRRIAAGFGWLVCLAFLVAGVPLFLRMPPWCDLTLYEMAARTVMQGGTHYQDVFDTNFPGFVWCLVGVRRLGGPSLEVVRAVDLAIVLGITLLLFKLAKQCGATPVARAWLAAAMAALYPFTCEFCHCQRDVWMTLPILAASWLRLRHLQQGILTHRTGADEGLLWALAVWIKPHVIIIALAVWWMTRRDGLERRADLRGNLMAGMAVGALGFAWLIVTGTIGPFFEVLTRWNSRYLLTIWGDLPSLATEVFFLFRPWSFLHVPAMLIVWRVFRHQPRRTIPLPRLVLCTLYFAFLFEACFTQRYFDYVHLPVLFLAFAVLTSHRWWWLAAGVAVVLVSPLIERLPKPVNSLAVAHPIWNSERMANWHEAFADFDTQAYRVRQQRLALNHEFFAAVNPVQIGEVAEFLRTQNVIDGEVIAWHDSPHAVYLELGIQTRFRFMHVTTTLMSEATAWKMTRELRKSALPTARFVVTDLLHTLRSAPPDVFGAINTADADGYPVTLPAKIRRAFPYCLPVVFRSGGGHGRYLVHRVTPGIVEQLDSREIPFEFEVNFWK